MSPTRLSTPGIYLLRPPGKFCAVLGQETLIAISGLYPKVIGVVLYQHANFTQDVTDLLDKLWNKMREELALSSSEVTVKVFGMQHPDLALMKKIKPWIERRGLKIGACDTGKRLVRELFFETQELRIGVKYSEVKNAFFLPSGTRRNRRNSFSPKERNALVVSANRVSVTLMKVAIEEIPGWVVSTANSLESAIAQKGMWDLIVICDDLPWLNRLEPWVQSLAENYPEIRLAWSGNREVPFSCPIQRLPLIDEKNLPKFKAELRDLLHHPLHWPAAGTLALRRLRK